MMKSASRQKLSSGDKLKDVLKQNRRLGSGGVYSVCSAHPGVLEAAIQEAVEDNTIFLVESTSGQVNQEGGYTGQTPEEFAKSIRSAATRAGLAADQVLLGGDHFGPFPWRTQNSSIAMEKACALVHACVLAGYQKIHLDASMPCADDLKNPLEAEVVAQRAAALAEAAEKAFAELRPGCDPPVYVIGTEVPVITSSTAWKVFDHHLPGANCLALGRGLLP
jgi:D-tagatose-1,6-bisphosphate aldolase subunit GatZ/KbaZ